MPSIPGFARLRSRLDQLCAGCGLPLAGALFVRDIDTNGELADYHQTCAPSLAEGIAAERLGRGRDGRALP